MVSTHLKYISQNGNLPQIGVKIENIWNHHLGIFPTKNTSFPSDFVIISTFGMCALIVGFAAAIGPFGCRGFFGFTGFWGSTVEGMWSFGILLPSCQCPLAVVFCWCGKKSTRCEFCRVVVEVKRIFLWLAIYNPVPKMKPSICLIKAVAVLENSFVFPFNFHSELHCETHQHPENNLDKGVRQRTLGGG